MASGSFFVLFAKPTLALRRTLSLRTQLLAIQTALESDHTLLKQQAPSTPSTPAPEKPKNKHSGWLVPQSVGLSLQNTSTSHTK